MDILVEKIKVLFSNFQVEADKTGNKAAARRARKLSLEIDKMLKQYRKGSVK